MRKIHYFLLTVLSAALFASCSSKIGDMPAEYFQVEPQVLELKTGKIDALVTAKFPPKFFAKKATLTITPVLVGENGKELTAASATYQGEKVKGNAQTISYKEGGNGTQAASFVYEDGFQKSGLYVDLAVKAGKKEYKLPRVKIADGVVTTPALVSAKNLTPSLGEDKFQKVIQQTYEAEIKFLIQQANVRESELKSQGIVAINNKLKESKNNQKETISGIDVQSYASPDGPQELNTKLAEQRQKNTVNYLNKELKKQSVKSEISTKFTAEDWDGFKQLVQASSIQDKDRILNILATYSDPDQREAEIKKMSSVYKGLAEDILPQLRRSKIKMTLDILGKSDQEILDLVQKDPKSLTADELLYAATLVTDKNAKAVDYQAVIDNYSQDWRGYNNLGYVKYLNGDYAGAASLFEKAYSISGNSNTNYNLALVALVNKDYTKASSYLAAAQTQGAAAADLAEARAVIQIYNGDYTGAVASTQGKNSDVAALSQILVNDYNKATATLNAVKNPDATTYYLKAIVGARTNAKDQVISNLKSAIAKDSSMAKKALNDIEFSKYFVDQDFLSIVK